MSDQANHLLHLLNDIERAVVFLTAQPAVREIGSQARNPNRPGSREPVSLDLIDAMREIPDAIGEIAYLVYKRRIETGAAHHGDGTEDSAFTFLRTRAAWIAEQPWADTDITKPLTALRHRLQRTPGSPLLTTTTQLVVCPDCGDTITVRAHDRGTHIEWAARCGGCHRSFTEAAVEAAQQKSLSRLAWRTAAEIVHTLRDEGLRVTAAQIRTWADRGHIAADTDREAGDPRRFLTDQVRAQAQPGQRHAQVCAWLDAQRDTA